MLGNILEQEDIIKGLPDDYLYAEAEQPSGQLPPFLVVSEIQRRTDMRDRYEATQDQPQGTVTEQIIAEGLGGIPQASPMDMASQTMGSPIPTDPASQVPVGAATGAFPDGGMAIGDSGLAGMGGQPQMVAGGGRVGMFPGGTAGGGSNMVAAVNAAIDMLRAEGRDPGVYSQYDLRIMGEEILGTDRPPTLQQQGYRHVPSEDTELVSYGDRYEPETVSGYRTSPFAPPQIIDETYEAAGAAKDWVVDTAGDVADYVREDEQLGTLGEIASGVGNVVSEGLGAVTDAYRQGLDERFEWEEEQRGRGKERRGNIANWFMDTLGIEDRMAAGMFGEPDEASSLTDIALDDDPVDANVVATTEDEILSVGDLLGKDYGKNLPLGGTGDAQLADALLKRTPSALETDLARRQQEYLTESEALTAENVEAEESIVADYRDRIERSQQQARDDAFNSWLGYFGAGVAGGDMAGGLERGAASIGDIKKESRETTLALEEGIVASERSRRKAAVDALKSMADIDVNFLKLANEVSRENGLMDRSDDDKQIALMNLIGDLMPDTTIATPLEIETNLTTMFNAVAHLFGLPQVSTTGGGGGGVGTDPTTRVPITDFNQ